MIEFNKSLDYKQFKTQLLNSKFLCKKSNQVNDAVYLFEDRSSNQNIFNSYFYKLSREYINDLDLSEEYKGNRNLDKFNDEFLIGVYKRAVSLNKQDTLLKSINNVFEYIFDYPKFKISEIYTHKEIYNFDKEVNSDMSYQKNEDIGYIFVWDKVGFSFGKIQINLKENPQYKECLVEIGIDEKGIEFLTTTISKEDPRKNSQSFKQEMDNKARQYDKYLKEHKDIVDKYCLKFFNESYSRLCSNDVLNKVTFESETTFALIVDYDNQFGFSEGGLAERKILEQYNFGKTITNDFFHNFKLNTAYGKKYPNNVIKRTDNVKKHIKPTANNVSLKYILSVISPEQLMNVVAISEIGLTDRVLTSKSLLQKYKSLIVDEALKQEIVVEEIRIKKEEVEEIRKEDIQKVTEIINKDFSIPSSITEDTHMNTYNVRNMTPVVKTLLSGITTKYSEFNFEDSTALGGYGKIKSLLGKFTKLCEDNLDLTINLEKCSNELNKLNEYIKTASPELPLILTTPSKECIFLAELEVVITYFDNYVKAYDRMMNNEYAKSDMVLFGETQRVTNMAVEVTDKEFIKDTVDRFLGNSFLAKKKKLIKQKETDDDFNAITYFFKNSKFLDLKQAEYRNLEASLRQSHKVKPGSLGCQKIWIIIYVLLALISSKKTKEYKNGVDINKENFIDAVSMFFDKIKKNKWNHDYSSVEKIFSMTYPFVKYKNNPFTFIMMDKGFNDSQETAKDLRVYVERQSEKFMENIKEFVYGKNRIYDILQGLADIAYELSEPFSLYTDFDINAEGENVVNQFLNACVSAVEMQTAMTVYQFLFDFKIPIGKKKMSLNDINNMIKIFNLIVDISHKDSFNIQLANRSQIAKQTSTYHYYKDLGFFTYNKEWNDEINPSKELMDSVTGFYLSNEPVLCHVVEYLRRKKVACKPGDIYELNKRFYSMEEYEWLACYGFSRLINEDKKFLSSFTNGIFAKENYGYILIKDMVDMLVKEGSNKNPQITYLNPYLENLGIRIQSHPEEYENFKSEQRGMFRRFKYNIMKNEEICSNVIGKELSDEKMYDWLMKMLPSYELIANAFGFANLGNLSIIDTFIDNLMTNINIMITGIFDKWKKDIVETTKLRRYHFIEKEKYYYIQAFPILVDWTIKNLEHYILGCNMVTKPTDIDINTSNDNLDKIDNMAEHFLILLKEEVAAMSSLEIKEFANEFYKSMMTIDGMDKEVAKQLLKDILQIDSMSEYASDLLNTDITKLDEKQKEELAKIIEDKFV